MSCRQGVFTLDSLPYFWHEYWKYRVPCSKGRTRSEHLEEVRLVFRRASIARVWS